MKSQRKSTKTRHNASSAKAIVKGRPSKARSKPTASKGRVEVSLIRRSLGLSRKVFSRLSGYSERAIADWEAGEPLSEPSRQRMVELDRLRQGLSSVMQEDYVGEWLQAPNDAFDGLKPLEVIERGQIDRVWRMIYLLESGVPG